jgi:hypothetical protein
VKDELGEMWGSLDGIRLAWHTAPPGSPVAILINGSPPATEEERNLVATVMQATRNVLAADTFRVYRD